MFQSGALGSHSNSATPKKRRVYRGRDKSSYAGFSNSSSARLVGDEWHRVDRRLKVWYSMPENAGGEGNPAVLGRFIQTYLNEESNQTVLGLLNSERPNMLEQFEATN